MPELQSRDFMFVSFSVFPFRPSAYICNVPEWDIGFFFGGGRVIEKTSEKNMIVKGHMGASMYV